MEMKKERVAGLILKDKKVLLVRDVGSSYFSTPGGVVEKNETKEKALIREIKEELGINVEKINYYFCFEFMSSKYDMPQIEYVYILSIRGRPRGLSEVSEIRWFDREEINSNPGLFLDMQLENLFRKLIREKIL